LKSSLILVGAGDHGRGTLEILRARESAGLPVRPILGFVDDATERQGGLCGGLPVLGTLDWLLSRAGDPIMLIIALASPEQKRDLSRRLDAAGFAYADAIHPSAILGAGLEVGPGAIIGAGVVVAYDTLIGRHTTINLNASIGHDCVIGDFSTIAPGVNMTGRVRLLEGTVVQTNATLVPGIKLGPWAQVGPGAVVLQDVAEGEAVFGNPARKMSAAKREHP